MINGYNTDGFYDRRSMQDRSNSRVLESIRKSAIEKVKERELEEQDDSNSEGGNFKSNNGISSSSKLSGRVDNRNMSINSLGKLNNKNPFKRPF